MVRPSGPDNCHKSTAIRAIMLATMTVLAAYAVVAAALYL
jgi:hypothetical protein